MCPELSRQNRSLPEHSINLDTALYPEELTQQSSWTANIAGEIRRNPTNCLSLALEVVRERLLFLGDHLTPELNSALHGLATVVKEKEGIKTETLPEHAMRISDWADRLLRSGEHEKPVSVREFVLNLTSLIDSCSEAIPQRLYGHVIDSLIKETSER